MYLNYLFSYNPIKASVFQMISYKHVEAIAGFILSDKLCKNRNFQYFKNVYPAATVIDLRYIFLPYTFTRMKYFNIYYYC